MVRVQRSQCPVALCCLVDPVPFKSRSQPETLPHWRGFLFFQGYVIDSLVHRPSLLVFNSLDRFVWYFDDKRALSRAKTNTTLPGYRYSFL